ncbi:MAG: UMP kinase [Oscillospiraceae bacterium]|nr:UMP kinase [Oscillospiraceae bacterium]
MEEKKPVYKRVLLKLSGEALSGDAGTGLDFKVMEKVCGVVAEAVRMGVEIGIVVGGGNFWRGVKNGEGRMDRARADYMGMLATIMNCLAIQDVLLQQGVDARVLTAMEIQHIGEPFSIDRAEGYLKNGSVVVLGGGVGSPYFTTDTGAVLRAALIHAEAILLAKNIDGVYSADPRKDPAAVKYDSISYEEVLEKRLAVMDTAATCIAMENQIPVMVFALKDPENILRALRGETVGTLVK